ncbi:hypothetical protein FHS31_000817 [Sphingomonas vulcanisoli]|uniref:Uncharacterized protein n=1 Tax=Sphingomonas vulcanisoli TaxID=1658060 RepID=A0ABX0TP76_9SPHN|nr:hypothetical protein [Sphingomonas vulcanisoli]
MATSSPAAVRALEELQDIKSKLASLLPDYQRPDRYYQRRDDLVDRLDKLTRSAQR